MSTMLDTTNEFPVAIELGQAVISKSAADAVRLKLYANQEARVLRVRQLAAAMVVEMENLRKTSPVAVRESRVAIEAIQTAAFWCATGIIKTI